MRDIYLNLKENTNCDIWIDSSTRLILFPVAPTSGMEELPYVVCAVSPSLVVAKGLRSAVPPLSHKRHSASSPGYGDVRSTLASPRSS